MQSFEGRLGYFRLNFLFVRSARHVRGDEDGLENINWPEQNCRTRLQAGVSIHGLTARLRPTAGFGNPLIGKSIV